MCACVPAPLARGGELGPGELLQDLRAHDAVVDADRRALGEPTSGARRLRHVLGRGVGLGRERDERDESDGANGVPPGGSNDDPLEYRPWRCGPPVVSATRVDQREGSNENTPSPPEGEPGAIESGPA